MRWLIAFSLMLAAGSARAEAPWREQLVWVPMQDASLYTRICRPPGESPARLVLINHGKPPDADMPKVQPASCGNEAVQWFLTRGFVVVSAVRRGYGATKGEMAEGSRTCGASDLVRAALEGARDMEAVRGYATALPYVRPDGVVVVGQSVGGWVTDGYDSVPHPGVVAMVSMAGGHGGHVHDIPNNNCRPDQLALAAGILGRTATTPMLWVYTQNDSYFAPPLAKAMYDAFTGTGGKAEFYQLPAFHADGHTLFFASGGSAVWGPLMEAYLKRNGGL